MAHLLPNLIITASQDIKRRVYPNLIIAASLDCPTKKRKVSFVNENQDGNQDGDVQILIGIPPHKKTKYTFDDNNSNHNNSQITPDLIQPQQSKHTKYIQFDPETLHPYFKLSQNNTIIETGNRDETEMKGATLAVTHNKVYPSKAVNNLFYFETKILRMTKKADLMIGICSSNINVNAWYSRVPIICGWDISFGHLMTPHSTHPCKVFPPREGETVGFLLDWETKEYNGAIRIFKNGKEIMQKPFIKNLKNTEYIFGAIPPFSLCIASLPLGIGEEYFRLKMISNPNMPDLHSLHRFADACSTIKVDQTNKLILWCQ